MGGNMVSASASVGPALLSSPSYERPGFLRYKDNINASLLGYVVSMAMLNEDSVHFGAIRSLSFRICAAHLLLRETTEWFEHAFPKSRRTISDSTTPSLPDLMEPSSRLAGVYLSNGLSPDPLQSLLAGGKVLGIKAGDLYCRLRPLPRLELPAPDCLMLDSLNWEGHPA
jgi:hypothetical protein